MIVLLPDESVPGFVDRQELELEEFSVPEVVRLPHRRAHPPDEPEIIEHEAPGYRAWRTPEAEFLARQIDRLAQLIRWTGATTPEQHEERMEVWDAGIRDRSWDMGYHEGLEAGRRECRCGTCFMDRD